MPDFEALMRANDPASGLVVGEVAVPRPVPERDRWRPTGQLVPFVVGVVAVVAIIGGIFYLVPQAAIVGGEGDYPYYSTAAELEQAADTIVLGDVTGERSANFEGLDYRVVSVAIVESAKGVAGSTIEVKLMPGTAEGDSNLQVGKRYVLLLVTYDDVPASTLNPSQGSYEVVDGIARPGEGNTVPLPPAIATALGLE